MSLLHRAALTLLLVALPLSGCSDTLIDPFDNDGRYFTVYGFLDLLETEHTLRVVPVTRFSEEILSPDEGRGAIDAKVYTTDLTSEERTEWTHHYTQLEDGSWGHLFKARFLVRPGRTYRLEVVRSDGKMATAETEIPYFNENTLIEKGPIVFEQDSTYIYQDVTIPEISSPWDVTLIYQWSAYPTNRRMFIPYGRPGYRESDGGWTMRINLSEDQVAVKDHVRDSFARGIPPDATTYELVAMGVQVRVLDENWDPPGGIFDPEVLAQPGVMSNVENGYGFFGSIGLYAEEWNIAEWSEAFGHPF
ncbi:MAG: hypothetical protein O3C45_07315 [Bacteroidetes bacterium]|nr:hypothetical protein [Bacteroidota bacterium]MDA0874859.1 hypothetical protein [Bacteroidota bacterium]